MWKGHAARIVAKEGDKLVQGFEIWNENTGGAKKYIHILRDVICVLLFEVELKYGSNV
jgi:hypothetical protein